MDHLFSSLTIVAAGFASIGDEWREQRLDVRQLLGLASEGSFCYFMRSSDMSAAGIMQGDVLIASPTLSAGSTDIIIATIDEVTQVRRLLRIGSIAFLVPEDPAHPHAQRRPLLSGDSVLLEAVVLCTIHGLSEASRLALSNHPPGANVNRLLGLHLPSIFCTLVKGTSMQGAGVFDGDILVIDRAQQPAANDVIIASVNGHFVVKRFIQARGSVFLLSDNPLTPPMLVTTEMGFQVWGVALFSLHLLHRQVRERLQAKRKQTP
jgi:DNA polymerase V